MIEIRFHGRGGQGAVTSAEIVATSAIKGGKYAQAFPSFGPERRGAPVVAFARIADEKILNRSAIINPDVVVVLDPALIKIINVTQGLKRDGHLILNSSKNPEEITKTIRYEGKLSIVNATEISLKIIGLPITNMVMLGGFVKVTGIIDPIYIEEAIESKFPPSIAEKNVKAFKTAISQTKTYTVRRIGK